MKDVLQYDGEPGVTLYYARPDRGDVQAFLYFDKKLKKNFKRGGKTIMIKIRDIYGVTQYPGKGVYKSEKVVGKVNESLIKESNNNETSKRRGLPRGKHPYLKTDGVSDYPASWSAKVNYWRKALLKMTGYEVVE